MLGRILAVVVAVDDSLVLVLPVDEVEVVLPVSARFDRSVHLTFIIMQMRDAING